jgi:vacuolar-type H+-ATPase subunit I/STV1
MKWFVTDAQLAALRLAAEQSALATHAAMSEHDAERYEAELARLRDDRREELARLADPQGPFVQHLRDEVAYWRHGYERERQRAEVAIDQCRVTHQGLGPVSLPPREDRPPRAGLDLFTMEPELARMGAADGV